MSDPPDEALPGGEPDPAPEADEPSQASQHDAPGVGETSGPNASEEEEVILGAAELAENIKARRQMRQAGLESLGGTWFGGAARFGGPASFGGHAAARDVNIYYGRMERTTAEAGPIAPERLARIRSSHVASPSCAAAGRMLRDWHLIVLRGADGSGRRTTALFMLSGLVADDQVHAVSANVVLGSRDASTLHEGAGYLAECRAPEELMYTHLAALSAELSQRGAYLVITVPAGTPADTGAAEHFIVDHEPPDCHSVVSAHLGLHVRHGPEAERLLRESQALCCVTSPGVAAELAEELVAVIRDGRPAADVASIVVNLRRQRARHLLRTDRPRDTRERVELLCRRAALVSIAVFAGLPYADALAAGEVLATRFIAVEFPATAGREVFLPWREPLLAEPDIVTEESGRPGRWGPTVTQQLRFRDPEFHLAVIEEVWEHYDAARSPMLQWLSQLATSSHDEAVRVRAAQVVGSFAVRDFDHICHRMLLEWSDSMNAKPREAAATALEAVAVSASSQVWNVLAEWCRDGNRNFQRTAVLALGTAIGERHPDETLDRLRQLALRSTGRGDRTLGEAVRRSVTELVSGPHHAAVVRALRTWAEGSDLRLRRIAHRCVPPLVHVTNDSGRPLLLLTLSSCPDLCRDAAVIVGAALEEPDTRQETWTALEKLTTVVAGNPGLTDTLGELLAELARISGTAANQLIFYLRLWAHRHSELTAVSPAEAKEAEHAGC
ncbi:MAG TPA: hypothetical protein VGS19_30350 [Streptosporangiaceae bacterium]|nr:hypothetical protein [Streptosporangiaceae bacterium]